jgi:hypothetical protein
VHNLALVQVVHAAAHLLPDLEDGADPQRAGLCSSKGAAGAAVQLAPETLGTKKCHSHGGSCEEAGEEAQQREAYGRANSQ